MLNPRAIMDPRVRAVAEFVREHISDSRRLSLIDAARLANVSPEHFCRVFRARTGLSFTEWQCAFRMEHAKCLILDRWIPLAVVAVAVGYDHAATFTRVFKRYEGVSPKELRPFANTYPELADALRSANARIVFRVGPLAWRNRPVLSLLEILADRLGQVSPGPDPGGQRFKQGDA